MEFKAGDRVKVSWGRNEGKFGKVEYVEEDKNLYFIDFGGKVYADSIAYADAYYVRAEFVSIK